MFKKISRSLKKPFNAICHNVIKLCCKTKNSRNESQKSNEEKLEFEKNAKEFHELMEFIALPENDRTKEQLQNYQRSIEKFRDRESYFLIQPKPIQPKQIDAPITSPTVSKLPLFDMSFKNLHQKFKPPVLDEEINLSLEQHEEEESIPRQAQEIHDDASVATQVTDNTRQGIARRQANNYNHDSASVLDEAKTSEIKENKRTVRGKKAQTVDRQGSTKRQESKNSKKQENKLEVLDKTFLILKEFQKLAKSGDAKDKKFIGESLKPDLEKLFQTVRDKEAQIIRGIGHKKPNVADYFKKHGYHELCLLKTMQIQVIRRALGRDNHKVVDYFKKYSPKDLSVLSASKMEIIIWALERDNQKVVDYFKDHSPQDLSVLNNEQMFEIGRCLMHDNDHISNFFQGHTPKQLSEIKVENMKEIRHAFDPI